MYHNTLMPIRWLAPEAIIEDDHNMKTSVFSWAWLVWEIFTKASLPHENLTDSQVRLNFILFMSKIY